MSDELTKEEKKARKRHNRRGALRDSNRTVRTTTAVLLAVASVALSFTQLGFAGIGLPGEYVAYAAVILQPIALAALLLGVRGGTLLGLFCGIVQYAHAIIMPLDFHEMAFVTPFTSIILLTVCGFVAGSLFSFTLRNNPGQVKRIVYILIVCIIVSSIYSLFFIINAVFSLVGVVLSQSVAGYTEAEVEASLNVTTMVMELRTGSIDVQMWFDAILMAVLCIAADVLVRKAVAYRGTLSVRSVFAAWLSVVVVVAFMVTATMTFALITQGDLKSAEDLMDSETNYLINQMKANVDRIQALSSYLDDSQGSDEGATGGRIESVTAALTAVLSNESILEGYTPEDDGTVLVTYGTTSLSEDTVYLSNNDVFSGIEKLGDQLELTTLEAMKTSQRTGHIQRIIDDGVQLSALEESDSAATFVRTQISYVLSKEWEDYTITMIMPAEMVFADRGAVMLFTTISEFILLAVVFAMTALLLNRVLVRRIDETNGVLAQVTSGDLDARVNVRDTREFASLSEGINDTVETLKGWISEAETRMDAELATAKAIQEAALPRVFPPFPSILRFDIYASMKAAKEVGGDFYDFFLIGDNNSPDQGKLGFVIADVSGKGVPAALFMMKAKTQIRDYLENGVEVSEAVENANRQLCDGNDAGMFVTAWVGVLDYATGHIDYVNAGHNPPLLWGWDEGWRWVEERSGLPLGLFDGLGYEAFTLDCALGEQLLLYTDGVTEAMSVEEKLYGEERLMELAKGSYALHPRALVNAVQRSVARHARGAAQSDDITILALEVGVPPEITVTLTVPADVDELPRVNEFIHAELERRKCPLRTQKQLDIAVEELFVNVAHYAYPDATPENPGMVRVSYTCSSEPPSVTVDIADDGIPYDPLAKPDAVTPDNIMDVPIGGLGILMAKNSVDEMHYERIDGANVVTIVKRW